MKTILITAALALCAALAGQAQNLPGFAPLPTMPSYAAPMYLPPVPSFPLQPTIVPPYVPPVTSTQTQMGPFGFYHDSLGTNGTSTQLGNFGFSTYTNGTRSMNCNSTRIGGYLYTNCN